MNNYEELLNQEIYNQDNYYKVFVSGKTKCHTHYLKLTKKETITLSKCKSIVNNLKDYYFSIDKIEILLTQYDYKSLTPEDYEMVLSNDFTPSRIGCTKKAIYIPSKNRLTIYESGLPIYENDNGNICNDSIALCDCIND